MRYRHYFLSRTGVDYGLGLNSPFHPRFGKRFLQVFYAVPTWDFIFHKCFTLSQPGISLFTSVLCRPSLGFHFLQVFFAFPIWDFVLHKCFSFSQLGISFFTTVLRRPSLGFHFTQVFYAVRLSDGLLTTTCARRNFNNETPPKD